MREEVAHFQCREIGRWFSHDTFFGLWCLAALLNNEWLGYTGA